MDQHDRDHQLVPPEGLGQWRSLRPVPIAFLAAGKAGDKTQDSSTKRRKKRRPKQPAAESFEATAQLSQPDEGAEPQEEAPEAQAAPDRDVPTLDAQQQDTEQSDGQEQQQQRADSQQQQQRRPDSQQQQQQQPKEFEVTDQELINLPIDRLNSLSRLVWQDALRKGLQENKVVYKGRRISLQKLLELYDREKKIEEMSGYEAGMRTGPEAEDNIRNHRHGSLLRPDAHKMQLRPHEEQALELDLYGRGVDIGPTRWLGMRGGGERKYSFGVYGRCQLTQDALQKDWAGRDPDKVLLDQEFYDDIVYNGHKMELTIMAHPVIDLPLEPYRHAMLQRLWINMASRTNVPVRDGKVQVVDELLELEAEDQAALQEINRDFSPERLQGLGMVDSKHNIKAGSHWIFTMGPNNELYAEGVTAGKLKERDCVMLGIWKYPRLTRALFDAYLGPKPVDLSGKLQVGQGILYVTNGFRFDPSQNPNNVNTFYEDNEGNPIIPEAQPTETESGEWDIADASDRPKLLLRTASAVHARQFGLKHSLTRPFGSLFRRIRRQ